MVDHQRAVCAGASLSDTSSSVRGFDLDALILALSRQRRTFFAVLGAALTATLVASLLATKQYTATSLIQLMPRAGQEMEVNEVVKYDDGGYLESRDRARTQIQIILSRSVRQSVVELYNERGHTDFDTSPTSLGILKDSMYVAPREDTQLVEIKVTPGRLATRGTWTPHKSPEAQEDSQSSACPRERRRSTWSTQRPAWSSTTSSFSGFQPMVSRPCTRRTCPSPAEPLCREALPNPRQRRRFARDFGVSHPPHRSAWRASSRRPANTSPAARTPTAIPATAPRKRGPTHG